MGENRGRYQGKRLISGEKGESRGRRAARKETADRVEEIRQETAAGQERGARRTGENKPGFWKDYGYLIITAAVVLLVFRVLLQLAYVPSGSMENTIPRDSLLVSWQLPYLVSDPAPERGDIVTFWNEEENKLLVKRVIGLAGEEITFSDGYVYVNGQQLEEEYLDQRGATVPQDRDTYQIPEGSMLMLGDNRTGSKDSRFWNEPYITADNVRARVMICIPLTRWHGIPLPQLGRIHLVG